MKVLVIGSGGREHTIAWKLAQSDDVSEIFVAPGNAGTHKVAQNIDIQVSDYDDLLEFALDQSIDLTIVGPEQPLVDGIVDLFESKGLKIFGPNQSCARLEGSKIFSKQFMEKYNIPTARYEEYFTAQLAKDGLNSFHYPLVIKADGLAAGKGVIIAETKKEAIEAIDQMMVDHKFGKAGSKIILESFLTGTEASILCLVDGETILPLESAQDYKKAFDNDGGLNTGGMGTYSPNRLFNDDLKQTINDRILKPFMKGLKEEKMVYKGIIFIGVMIDGDDINVLEFNVRFGDPETQVVLPRLKNDLSHVFLSTINGQLNQLTLNWDDQSSVCVVLASGGYPLQYEKGKIIHGLTDDHLIFHAGTKETHEGIVTNGGRVLGVVALDDSLEVARTKAYAAVDSISFDHMHYRKDIGL